MKREIPAVVRERQNLRAGNEQDWVKEHWTVVKCTAQAAADIAYSAWAAGLTAEPGGTPMWKFVYDGAVAAARLVGCLAPSESVIKGVFDPGTLKCQCAAVGGQLFVEYIQPAGNEVTAPMSDEGAAKVIEDQGVNNGTPFCQYTSVDGLFTSVSLNAPYKPGTRPFWYIKPIDGTGCCSGVVIPDPVPQPVCQVFPHPDFAGDEIRVCLLDSCIDKFGVLQNFYWVGYYADYGGEEKDYYYELYYWETIYGPVVYVGHFYTLPLSYPQISYPHPHAACCCSSSSSSDTKPTLEGDWRTISFRSDQVSPYGKSRLRKRFRYRSTSSLGLGDLVDHWRDFTFEAGPVCVIHKGASWGTPQVWASTADEGKRVIRHAGGEAGVMPDQDGEWVISGSSSGRVGVEGTMRVDTKGGYYWITARDGSDGRPMVAVT